MAVQIEASLLAAIEERDADQYQQEKARRDLQLTHEGVRHAGRTCAVSARPQLLKLITLANVRSMKYN